MRGLRAPSTAVQVRSPPPDRAAAPTFMEAAFLQHLDGLRDAPVADWEHFAREQWSDDLAARAARALLLDGPPERYVLASWLLKRTLEEGQVLDGRLRGRLARSLRQDWPWEARLHVLQCVAVASWSPSQATPLLAFAETASQDPAPFVRAWGFNAQAHLQLVVLDDQAATEQILKAAELDPKASVRARARSFRKQHRRALTNPSR